MTGSLEWSPCQNNEKSISIHRAAQNGDTTRLKRILSEGTDVNLRTHDRSFFSDSTPLHVASSAGNINSVDLLLINGADASLTDSCGRTALQYAQLWNRSQVVKRLELHLKAMSKSEMADQHLSQETNQNRRTNADGRECTVNYCTVEPPFIHEKVSVPSRQMAETAKKISGGNYHKGLLTMQQSCGISACSSDTALDMHVTNTPISFKLIGWGLQGMSENNHSHYPESRSATSGVDLCASVSGDWKFDLKTTLTYLAYRGVSLATKPLTNKRLNESTIRTIPPHAQPDLQGSKPDPEVQVCPQGDKFPDALEGFGEKSARVVLTTTMDTNTVGKSTLEDGILYTFKATLEAHSPGMSSSINSSVRNRNASRKWKGNKEVRIHLFGGLSACQPSELKSVPGNFTQMTETTNKSNDKSVVDERRRALTSATGQTGSVSSTSALSGLKVSECTKARPPWQAQRDTHKVSGASTTNTTASADKLAAAQEGCKKQARLGSGIHQPSAPILVRNEPSDPESLPKPGHAPYLLRRLDATDNVQVPRTPEAYTSTVSAAARVSATEGDIHTSLQRISPAYTRRILSSADDSDGFSSDLSDASSDDEFDFVLGRAGSVSASHVGPGPGRVMVSGGRDTCTKVTVIDRNEHITGLGLATVGVRNVVQEVRELKGSDSAKTRRSREEVRGNVSNMLITRKHACDDVSMKFLTRKEMSKIHESMDAGKSHTRVRQPCVGMVNVAMSKKKSSAVITGTEMSKRHASTDVEIPDTPEQLSLIDVGEIKTINKQPCVKVKDDMIQEEANIDGAKNKMTGKQPFSDAAEVDLSGSQICDYAATMKLNGEELCCTVSKTELKEKHFGAHVVGVSVTKQQDGDVEINKGQREKSTRQIVGKTATGGVSIQKTSIDTIQPMFQKPICAIVSQRAQVCIKVQTTKEKVRRPEVPSTNERVAGEAFSSSKRKVGGVKATSAVQKVGGPEVLSSKGKVGRPEIPSTKEKVAGAEISSTKGRVGGPEVSSTELKVGGLKVPSTKRKVGGAEAPSTMEKVGGVEIQSTKEKVGGAETLSTEAKLRESEISSSKEKVGEPEVSSTKGKVGKPETRCSKKNVGRAEISSTKEKVGGPEVLSSKGKVRTPQVPFTKGKVGGSEFSSTKGKVGRPDARSTKEKVGGVEIPSTKEKVGRPEVPSSKGKLGTPEVSYTKGKVGGVEITSTKEKIRGAEAPSTEAKVGGPEVLVNMCTKTKSDGGSGNSSASTKKVAMGEKEKGCRGSPAVAKKIKTGVITKSAESTSQPDINSCPRPVVANEYGGEVVVVGDKTAANGKQICSKVSTTAAFVNVSASTEVAKRTPLTDTADSAEQLAKGECSNGNDTVDTEKIVTEEAAHPETLAPRMDAYIRTLPRADSSNCSYGSEKKNFSSQAVRELTLNLHMLTKTLERLVEDESTLDREVDPQQTNQCEKKAAVTAKQKSRNDEEVVQQNSCKMKHVQRQPIQVNISSEQTAQNTIRKIFIAQECGKRGRSQTFEQTYRPMQPQLQQNGSRRQEPGECQGYVYTPAPQILQQLPPRRHTQPWFYSQVYVQDSPQQSLYSTQSDQGFYRKTPYVQYYSPTTPLVTHRMSDPAPRPSHTQMYAVSENYAMPPAYLPEQHTHIRGPHQLPYAYVPSISSALPFTGMHAQHRQPDVNMPAYGPQTAMHPSQLHTHAPVHRRKPAPVSPWPTYPQAQQQTEGTGVSKVPASYRPQTVTSAVQSVHFKMDTWGPTRREAYAASRGSEKQSCPPEIAGDMARQNAQANPDTSTSSACEWNSVEVDRTTKNDGVVTVVPRIEVQSAAPAHLEGHSHSRAFLEAQAQRLVHTHSRKQTHAHAHGYNHIKEPNIHVQFHGGSTVVSYLRLPVDSLSYKYNPEAPKSSPMDLDRGLKNHNSDASDLTSQRSDPFVQGYIARRGLKV